MIVGVPKEVFPNEHRVALVPAVVSLLKKAGLDVLVQRGAGERAGFPDSSYESRGATLTSNQTDLFSRAEIVVFVRGSFLDSDESEKCLKLMRPGQILVGLLNPLGAPEAARSIGSRGVTSFALELLPRITRAQPMDALTSMATIAGYKSVLLAADVLGKMFPMMITAAGTITPARVFVVGAGVAGLQAISTARRLGAVVHSYDVRPAVKEQVESLGAKFVELGMESKEAEASGGYAKAMDEDFYRRQREMMSKVVAESDVVITTAAIPGKKAPVLLTEEMIRKMQPGSVVVDLAAESGGNCELTQPGETVEAHGVTIMGPISLPSTIPHDASQMYARNITAFLQNLVSKGEVKLNMEDPIIRETLLTHNGEVVNTQVRELLGWPPLASAGN